MVKEGEIVEMEEEEKMEEEKQEEWGLERVRTSQSLEVKAWFSGHPGMGFCQYKIPACQPYC